MHVQVRSSTSKGGFAADDPDRIAVSNAYVPGALAEMLGILADAGFNLRAAGGPRIELGGEFAFWVDPRQGDTDEHAAADAAVTALQEAGYDAWSEEVVSVVVADERGALRRRLDELQQSGILVEEILVGTPGKDTNGGIPVQIRTATLG
jgi:hypothetical protein